MNGIMQFDWFTRLAPKQKKFGLEAKSLTSAHICVHVYTYTCTCIYICIYSARATLTSSLRITSLNSRLIRDTAMFAMIVNLLLGVFVVVSGVI